MPKIRKLIVYPDPILHQVSEPVEYCDEEIREFCEDMIVTMEAAGGVGLSAIQVGVPLRIITFIDQHPMNHEVFINPEIVWSQGKQTQTEGCLSVPGVYEERERAEKIIVEYQDRYGMKSKAELTGLEAFCVQHEIDHLDGKVFIDESSPLKKKRARDKIKKTLRVFKRDLIKQKAYE